MWFLIPIGAIGLAVAWALSSKDEKEEPGNAHVPAPLPPAPTPVITDGPVVSVQAPTEDHQAAAEEAAAAAQVRDWQAAIVAAWASGDLAQIEQVARELEADGQATQAALMRQYVAVQRAKATAAVNEVRVETGHQPVTPAEIQKEEPAPLPAPPDPRILVAQTLTNYLAKSKKGSENKAEIANAQRALGVAPDGLYGIDTAAAVASFGVVPVPPWYLPSANTGARVAAFDALMEGYAVSDPPRASQWLYVAKMTKF